MATRQQRDLANWVLQQVGTVNPYNRQGENLKSEFYLYQGGFLAAYLASLMREDPFILRRFERHIRERGNRPRC